MDKKYQVFVSSTYEDLQEERKEVMQALLELDCIPAGMELFPASNDDQWTLIKRVIDDCDYYLLIVGGRYGSTNEQGKSFTQMEFEYALSKGKPIISFLPKNPDSIPSGKTEKDEEKRKKLDAFKVMTQKKLIKYWESAKDLGSVVSRSMIKLIRDFPAEGWVKSGSAVDEKSVKEIARLQHENDELKQQINNIATEAPRGSENLAQGEDIEEIGFSFNGHEKWDEYECNDTIGYTWNKLFECIAPHMIDECSEVEIKDALEEMIKVEYDFKETFEEFERISHLVINSESFNAIKIQFRALGYICLGTKRRSTTDKQTYWKLTPYGDYVMTSLLATKRRY